MEETKETHSGEGKVSAEKNQKRRLKTPDQVKALEKFYSDNKYPSEEKKSEIAEAVGLTEKQVSGWFCHRRLKDKRVNEESAANGRQDHSSGIIQDIGSGHRQDSCGSTKQGDHWHGDPREVESGSFRQQTSAAYITDEPRNKYAGSLGGVNDASSGSSSHSQEQFYSAGSNLKSVNAPKYLIRNGINTTNDARNIFSFGGYKPSGYLKVKRNTENDVITAVKRQLGRNYIEDGPPLGIEFDSPPPGAFDSTIRDASPGAYYAGNPTHSPDNDGIWRSTSVINRDIVSDPMIKSKISSKATNFSRPNSHNFDDFQSDPDFKQRHSPFSPHVQFSCLDPSSNMLEDSGDQIFALSGKVKSNILSKDKEEMGPSVYNQYNEPITNATGHRRLHEPASINHTNPIGSLKSRITSKKIKEQFVSEDKEHFEEKIEADYSDTVKVKMHHVREIPMAKQAKTKIPLQDFSAGASMQMR
ncbi:hypothetical protein SAY87_017948 [Trapa incisa]|uniref:Homeobox domain-containing protein n=1 Tax=Trapa incisa TaxID=236973 RepID=A0AAN7L2J4_9MYRT|nr:hypothetical protein SAY87_017948 [Trapa incisa]